MLKLFVIFSLFGICAACTAGNDGSQVVDVSGKDTGAQTVVSRDAAVRTLAIQPAFTKITGIGKTVQLSADIWLEGGEVLNDVRDGFTVAGGSAELMLDWETENFGVATVDENGLVTAVSAGDTFIKASIDGHEATARIVVESELNSDPNIDISAP